MHDTLVKPKKESDKIIKALSDLRQVDEEIIRDMMRHNVITPVQFSFITGLSRNKVEMMLYAKPTQKLTAVFPFSAFLAGEGPKFILKDKKFYELLKYLIHYGRKTQKHNPFVNRKDRKDT